MLTLLGLAAFVAILYFVYRWFEKQTDSVESDVTAVEADAVAVETKVQTAAATAEKVADNVVADIKAKL